MEAKSWYKFHLEQLDIWYRLNSYERWKVLYGLCQKGLLGDGPGFWKYKEHQSW
jgi:hypothetical protein